MMIDEIHKNRGHKIKSQKGKVNRRNSIRGTQRFTKPSPTVDSAKVQINSETAIPILENLKQKYVGTCNPYGFINDLRNALGIPTSKGSSKYGVVQIPTEDGVLESSICITNHNASAENYITYGCNLPYNLRLLIRKEFQTNRFHPHKDVKLDEYVYYAKRMQKVENPLCQIIDSLIDFLKTGQYKDTTGVAFLNQSPSTETDNNTLNTEQYMNNKKQIIRLTEADLHRIVSESVKDLLNGSNFGGVHPFVHELNCIYKSLANLEVTLAGCEIRDSAYGDIFNELAKVLVPYSEKISQARKYGLESLLNGKH